MNEIALPSDSYSFIQDTLVTDSVLVPDSINNATKAGNKKDSLLISPDAIESQIKYEAADSIIFIVDSSRVFLFGEAQVDYEKVNLKAEQIFIDQEKNTMKATGVPDSSGKLKGKPQFSDGDQNFVSKEINYNIKTKKGKIKDVTTVEGESFLRGESVKKDSDNVVFMEHGKYTTCNLEQPHFYFALSKLKVIPDDKIITGPANLVIGDVPTPLAVPFGFFPNRKGRASGILIPTYGEADNYGFFLKDGGYYLGLSDYVDLTLRGDIYTRGSWALRTSSNYAWRYHFTGDFGVSFSQFKLGEEGFPDYNVRKDFFIKWRHSQDPKAKPNSRFSADVNLGTSSFNRLNSNNTNEILSNTFQSSVQYYYGWQLSNLTVAARQSQNTANRKFDLSMPELTWAVNRFYPFASGTGTKKWYEEIGMSYTHNAKSQLNTYDSLLFAGKTDLQKETRYGMNHQVPLTTSFKVLRYFTFSPTVTYSESWYLQSIQKSYNADLNKVETDTLNGFKQARDLSLGTSLRTILYGMYQFRSGRLKAVRHVITPNLGFVYNPGLYKLQTVQVNAAGKQATYSNFEGGIFGSPAGAESGTLRLSMVNNLEMKVRSAKDTVSGFQKIKIFENLSADAGYDLLADSFNLSNIAINARTSPFPFMNINVNATADPYLLDPSSGLRTNAYSAQQGGPIARLVNMQVAVNFTLSSKKANPVKDSKNASKEEVEAINNNRREYVDFNVPWNLTVGYNYVYNRPAYETSITQAISFNGDFNVTANWKVGFNSGYDVVQKKFTYTNLNVYRNLHCWELRLNMVPFGFRKSYSIDINVKASVLQDMKLSRRRDWYDLQ